MRGAVAAVAGLLTAALLPGPAEGATRTTPGDFTGYAFDTCDAPSQRKMDALLTHSRYAGVGIYIAGMNRACERQRHLNRAWVAEQSRKGWRLLPLVVGRQAACSPKGRYLGRRIAADPGDRYARARKQGWAAAGDAADAARRLGIPRRSVIWFDLEHFDISRTHCRRSALTFVSSWTWRLHDLGYRSGLYSSASSGIRAVDNARRLSPGSYTLPDYLWIAEWNGRATVHSEHISRAGWWPHRRVHQYRGPHRERHGRFRVEVDSNFMSTGRGTQAGPRSPSCGVRVSFPAYPRLRRGDRGAPVRAAQCLLKQRGRYAGRVDGRFDRATERAVRRFQRPAGLRPTGTVGDGTWTALLAAGGTPLLKFGSGGDGVRRLQRALNAAVGARLAVDGVFSRADEVAVRRYQGRVGDARTGVVTDRTWSRLQRGRAVGRVGATAGLSLSDLLGATVPDDR